MTTPNPRSVAIPDAQYRRICLAATAVGMSASAFIRAASKAAVDSLEERDDAFRAYLAMLAERENVAAARDAKQSALGSAKRPERVSVTA